jgi:oligoendopeptidase F
MALLANIPTRFELEKNFYEARQNGTLTPLELGEITDKAWRKYFGEYLSETESQFWMTKLHFSIADVSFYNFPYTFGYLFSLGIYSQRTEVAESAFGAKYVDILRDTGRMTAESLIQKHLGSDIREKDFWRKSLKVVESKIAALERLLEN